MSRLGVTEWPAGLAVAAIAILQYAFLAKLWEGYPLRGSGIAISENVVIAGIIASLAGAGAIAFGCLRHWRIADAATRRLEHPARDRSFDPIRASLATVAGRSSLHAPPELRYTPRNAHALEVRDDAGAVGAVVVGLGQRRSQLVDPEAFAAQLGHEVSHLELAATRHEIAARRLAGLHFRVLAWLVLMLVLVLGFIDPRGIGGTPRFGGFEPVFAASVYIGLSAQFAVLVLSSAVAFVYSYFFAVRREYMHDVRGSQLAGTDALADRVFAPLAAQSTVLGRLRDFFGLHPVAAARRRVVHTRDIVLLSAIFYPAIIAGVQPLPLLLTAGWRGVFGIEEAWWNLGLTMMAGLLLYLALSADVTRLGIGALLGRRYWLRVPLYAIVAGTATQVPRIVLEVIFGARRGHPADVVIARISSGIVAGGGRIAVMVALLLLMLAYLAAVRVAATGEARAGRHMLIAQCVSALIVVAAFAISSMRVSDHIPDMAMVVLLAGMALATTFVLANHCADCGRKRLSALSLQTRCACGHEHLPRLRTWTEQPYRLHLPPAGACGADTRTVATAARP